MIVMTARANTARKVLRTVPYYTAPFSAQQSQMTIPSTKVTAPEGMCALLGSSKFS